MKFIDESEKDLINQINNKQFIPVKNMDFEIEKMQSCAIHTITKKKAINIRLLESDVKKIKVLAISEGIPYQTLISSIVHKYANKSL
jgi:predicted DNA binding CopG/RHH family protein